ncbi:MAG: hypothetical protein E7505_01895 [Ruminococcus sp.]|nr:hypothetical protein [Ruminococcus sp.]
MAAFGIMYLWILLLSLVLSIIALISWYKLFEKAGEAGWKAIVPFYSFFVYSKIATGSYKLPWIYMGVCFAYCFLAIISSLLDMTLLFLLPLLALYAGCIVLASYINYQFGKAFGRSTGWCIAMIFLGGVLVIPMAFDSSCTYVGPKGEADTSDSFYSTDSQNYY